MPTSGPSTSSCDELDNLLQVSRCARTTTTSWASPGAGCSAPSTRLRRPAGLRALVAISNSPASMGLWISRRTTRLRVRVARIDVRRALDRHEADGTMLRLAYLAAEQGVLRRHVCRVVPNPSELLATEGIRGGRLDRLQRDERSNEFFCIGTLREWSIVDRLASINVPTLLLSGRHDEATPATVQPYFDRIKDVRWEIFEASSHMPFIEERQRYMSVLEGFLDDHDRSRAQYA